MQIAKKQKSIWIELQLSFDLQTETTKNLKNEFIDTIT